ncbi:MAG: type II toxin-antitoxin system VapC family toxin [Cyanosarcina radialis HA8281-LM2]|jgi:PIN domain nuclease of toxin-antitoxin system|nr:type II toxin-antitoxin system VapC family toxin [Cyanosarcina radialis HA8281-LM2]
MKLLLDTHTFIWFITDNPQLSSSAKVLIEDDLNEKFLSLASIWEMAVKCSIGKLRFDLPFRSFIEQQLVQNSLDLMRIEVPHLSTVATLPLHHRDPFDRLLIAQAIVEQMPIVGADRMFDSYGVERLW